MGLNSHIIYELRFWLQIMGDHARFIKNSLNPDQANLVKVAANFIEVYDRLLDRAGQMSSVKESTLSEVTQVTLSLRDFKRELLAERLKNSAATSLPPTFYNHMLNELEDFLKTMDGFEAGRQSRVSILGLHLLWSSDAAAHAAFLGCDLDKVEYKLQGIAKRFEQLFDDFYLKAVELAGYFRSSPPAAQPALEAYNFEMTDRMKEFMAYLEDIQKGVTQQKILGRLIPLMPDHMFREECYYLAKIAEAQPNLQTPNCDPGRPRAMS